jgi:type IV pilus assembly protein PilE
VGTRLCTKSQRARDFLHYYDVPGVFQPQILLHRIGLRYIANNADRALLAVCNNNFLYSEFNRLEFVLMVKTINQGFTLIELMIAVAIVAILTAIALPSYQSYVQKSRRADAITALSALQLAEEKWRASNLTYTTALSSPPSGLGISSLSGGGYYTIAVASASATGYTLTATPVAGTSQASDTSCPLMTIVQTGGNTSYFDSASMSSSACWKK